MTCDHRLTLFSDLHLKSNNKMQSSYVPLSKFIFVAFVKLIKNNCKLLF